MKIRSMAAGFAVAAMIAWAPCAALTAPNAIASAVADASRPADDRNQDVNRKPALVLAYAGVKPGMTVGEYLPGGGYYTRLLSDIAGPIIPANIGPNQSA